MNRNVVFLLSFWLAILPSLMGAEPTQTQPPKRPKVGIALAGGSALGLAHIGVIRWLEEHHIPLDYVAGTSMGGLVGGLYASGYDYQEMSEFLNQIDWAEALQLSTPFDDLTFRRKEDKVMFPNQLEFGLRHGLSLPPSLSSGNGVGLVISRFTSPYPDMKSFDDLPTSFRCVAVDLKSGKQVIFQKGALFDALRSTMSLPGIFSPWKLGDQVLVDGGVLNNLPVDVAKGMGSEVVIAVALRSAAIEGKPPSSILGIANRSIDIQIAGNQQRNMGMADILLMPELDGFVSMDFHRGKELEQLGYEAAEKKARFLETLSVGDAEWAAYLQARQSRRRKPVTDPAFITVTAVPQSQAARAEEKISKLVGSSFSQKALEDQLTVITGYGRYESGDYRDASGTKGEGIGVYLRPKGYGPPFLNLGFTIDGSTGDGLRFGFGGRFTFLDLGGPKSEWRTDFNIGTLNNIATEYYWRPGGSRFFIAPRLFYDDTSFSFYKQGNNIFSFRLKEPGLGADVGYAGGRFSELRFGYQLARQSLTTEQGLPIVPDQQGNQSLLRMRFTFDNQDRAVIPTRGIRSITEGQWVMASPFSNKAYPFFASNFSWAQTLSPRYLFITSIDGGTTGSGQIPMPLFSLGGTLRLKALSRNQLLGSSYYYGSFNLLRSFSDNPVALFGKLYLAGSYEIGNAFFEHQSANPYQDGTIGIVGETFIGVFFLGGSVGESGEHKIVFRLGRLF
ncbi:MAG: patatin-like phospholipase family protein [Terriglobia bacterium]